MISKISISNVTNNIIIRDGNRFTLSAGTGYKLKGDKLTISNQTQQVVITVPRGVYKLKVRNITGDFVILSENAAFINPHITNVLGQVYVPLSATETRDIREVINRHKSITRTQ